ncbi:glycosyltransferase [Flavobacterium sp.]|jgi:cellulose synthase/poly-beta-1,6-N-acetylglucosamine synthase-like glycosyltransferase|uniref:glycosyltransferase family 2 protein n=1 Tax=Flavobacterium sp. TaxID=239 RepID=UPI0037BE76F3
MITIVLLLILFIYANLLVLFIVGTSKVKVLPFSESKSETCFSIVVPFRNEAANLPMLLQSFENLNYPTDQFEVILVDDDSLEKFQVSGLKFQVQLVPNQRKSNSPKKDAIQTAIKQAKYDWIVTTDGDCIVPENWLLDLNNYIQQTKKEMVCGPVLFKKADGFLYDFQQIELLSLQAVTIGSFGMQQPFMCNGANFTYSKSLFQQLNGFEGNNTIASGDDVFLLQKAVQYYPKKVGFLVKSNFLVQTKVASSWKELFYQRVRWAGKSTEYSSPFGKMVALVVLLGNLTFIVALLGLIFGRYECAFILFIKVLVDYLLARRTAVFYKKQMKSIFLTALIYPFFSTAVAFYSLFGSYQWKGRRF